MKAKKSLGQNFLHDKIILEKIIESVGFESGDWAVEVGPGTGSLTQFLSKAAKKVVAFELDDDLIPDLLKRFPLSSNVSILHRDILRVDMTKVLRDYHFPTDASYRVAANIPYYITSSILQYMFRLTPSPETIVLMMQQEVARRVTAKPGDLSILGVSVQYYADAQYLFTVEKTSFDPVPKVDSAVVKLIPKRVFDKEKDVRFFRFVKAGFSARRKTLANNIASGLHMSKSRVLNCIAKAGLDENVRAQALGVADWERLNTFLAESENDSLKENNFCKS